MLNFTWTPEFGATKSVKPNVAQVKFEGYEQRIAFGMNSILESWSLSFAQREPAEALAIETFLINRGAVEAFLWTPPGALVPLAFVCRGWEMTPQKGGRYSISCTFEQVNEP